MYVYMKLYTCTFIHTYIIDHYKSSVSITAYLLSPLICSIQTCNGQSCIYVCMYVHVYNYVCMYVWRYICMYVWSYTHNYMHVHTYIHNWPLHVCIKLCIQLYAYIYNWPLHPCTQDYNLVWHNTYVVCVNLIRVWQGPTV